MKRKKKKYTKTIVIGFFMTIIIAVIATTVWKQTNRKEENETKTVSISKIEEDTKLKENEMKLQEWSLRLVNKENFIPEDYQIEVAEIENGYKVDKRILANLSNMLKDARKEGLKPWICSSYRSSETQKRLFNNKIDYYKKQGYSESESSKKASYWIAIPRTSEHEIGLSVDIVSKEYQLLDKNQENTPEQKWLMKNCHQYGFVMRYQTEKKEITKIDYEPWHYRYVGIENAKVMKDNNFCLEEYIQYLKINGMSKD